MSPVLNQILSPHQHDFIKGRSILDNILLALLGIKFVEASNEKCVILQLDVDKDYDRVSWLFIEETMMALGFGSRMARAMRHLGKGSVSAVLFNGVVVGEFLVQRSIKQGCPLDPLHFAVCSHPLRMAIDY